MARRSDSSIVGSLLTIGAFLALGAGGYLVYSGIAAGENTTKAPNGKGQGAPTSRKTPDEVKEQLQDKVDLTQKKASVRAEFLTSSGEHVSRADFNRAWKAIPRDERVELTEPQLADRIRRELRD